MSRTQTRVESQHDQKNPSRSAQLPAGHTRHRAVRNPVTMGQSPDITNASNHQPRPDLAEASDPNQRSRAAAAVIAISLDLMEPPPQLAAPPIKRASTSHQKFRAAAAAPSHRRARSATGSVAAEPPHVSISLLTSTPHPTLQITKGGGKMALPPPTPDGLRPTAPSGGGEE